MSDATQANRPMSATQTSQTFPLDGNPNYALQMVYVAPASATDFTADDSDVCTSAAHGFYTGMKAQATTDDTLPAGLDVLTNYWVIRLDANTFKLASSLANADAGTAVDITDAGTGTHTLTATAGTLAHSVQLQKSVDGTTWSSEGSATAVSAAGATLLEGAAKAYRFLRLVNTVTTGQAVYTFAFNSTGLR